MSSGAFALYLDHEAGEGPNTPIRRVIPLPISDGAGIRFTHRQLSLAYDDFGGGPATISVTVCLITANGTVTSTTPMTIHVGCQTGGVQQLKIARSRSRYPSRLDPMVRLCRESATCCSAGAGPVSGDASSHLHRHSRVAKRHSPDRGVQHGDGMCQREVLAESPGTGGNLHEASGVGGDQD